MLVGSGALVYAALEVGAVGGILGIANMAPAQTAALHQAFLDGNHSEAGRLQERIGPLHKRVIAGTGVPGVKYALGLLGMAGGRPRSPLISPSEAVRAEVSDALLAAGLLAWTAKRTENLVFRGLADLRRCLTASAARAKQAL